MTTLGEAHENILVLDLSISWLSIPGSKRESNGDFLIVTKRIQLSLDLKLRFRTIAARSTAEEIGKENREVGFFPGEVAQNL